MRQDGMSQVEVAELLGRHKSWVCRRLALIGRLGPKARDDLRVGLLSPTAARQVVRLPEGNQAEVLAAIRREALTTAEWRGGSVVTMLRATPATVPAAASARSVIAGQRYQGTAEYPKNEAARS